ncbi:MAG: hypothetical protein DDT26_00816 [Dehalococcoidia bacterium]|nr:hypothetical protein [Chloroflexota bacterium]
MLPQLPHYYHDEIYDSVLAHLPARWFHELHRGEGDLHPVLRGITYALAYVRYATEGAFEQAIPYHSSGFWLTAHLNGLGIGRPPHRNDDWARLRYQFEFEQHSNTYSGLMRAIAYWANTEVARVETDFADGKYGQIRLVFEDQNLPWTELDLSWYGKIVNRHVANGIIPSLDIILRCLRIQALPLFRYHTQFALPTHLGALWERPAFYQAIRDPRSRVIFVFTNSDEWAIGRHGLQELADNYLTGGSTFVYYSDNCPYLDIDVAVRFPEPVDPSCPKCSERYYFRYDDRLPQDEGQAWNTFSVRAQFTDRLPVHTCPPCRTFAVDGFSYADLFPRTFAAPYPRLPNIFGWFYDTGAPRSYLPRPGTYPIAGFGTPFPEPGGIERGYFASAWGGFAERGLIKNNAYPQNLPGSTLFPLASPENTGTYPADQGEAMAYFRTRGIFSHQLTPPCAGEPYYYVDLDGGGDRVARKSFSRSQVTDFHERILPAAAPWSTADLLRNATFFGLANNALRLSLGQGGQSQVDETGYTPLSDPVATLKADSSWWTDATGKERLGKPTVYSNTVFFAAEFLYEHKADWTFSEFELRLGSELIYAQRCHLPIRRDQALAILFKLRLIDGTQQLLVKPAFRAGDPIPATLRDRDYFSTTVA